MKYNVQWTTCSKIFPLATSRFARSTPPQTPQLNRWYTDLWIHPAFYCSCRIGTTCRANGRVSFASPGRLLPQPSSVRSILVVGLARGCYLGRAESQASSTCCSRTRTTSSRQPIPFHSILHHFTMLTRTVLALVAHPSHATCLGIGVEMFVLALLKPPLKPPFGTA